MARIAAQKRLLARLVRARAVYDDDSERNGLKLAARACATYLDETDAHPDLKMMFLSLGLALEELDYGITHRALEAAPIKRKPRESMEKFIAKAYTTAVMELLMRGTMTKPEAARRTAQAVKHWPIFEGTDVTATTVVNWRDHVKAKLAADAPDKSFFDHLVSGLDLKEDARQVAEMLIEEGCPFGPRQRRT